MVVGGRVAGCEFLIGLASAVGKSPGLVGKVVVVVIVVVVVGVSGCVLYKDGGYACVERGGRGGVIGLGGAGTCRPALGSPDFRGGGWGGSCCGGWGESCCGGGGCRDGRGAAKYLSGSRGSICSEVFPIPKS